MVFVYNDRTIKKLFVFDLVNNEVPNKYEFINKMFVKKI